MNTSTARALVLTLSLFTGSVAITGCATAPATEAGKNVLQEESAATLARAQRNDPSLKTFMDGAAGYAVFPTVGKGAVGVGGAYGRGVLYEGGKVVGYCDLSQGTVGLQLGGQSYSELIVFKAPEAIAAFKSGRFAFSAQATAVAVQAGAGANARYTEGVAVFTMGESGLMFEASVGGQNFSYQAK